MQVPSWYEPAERKLLVTKPLLLLALGAAAVVSGYLFWEVAHDRKALPAAAWVTYLYMP